MKGKKGASGSMMSSVTTSRSSHLVGSWSFLVGIILAVLFGLGFTGAYAATMLWIVFLLGLVVGLLNITHDETQTFLVSGTVLVLVSFLGVQGGVFDNVAEILKGVLRAILTLFVPATIVVALRSVFCLARN